VGAIFCGSVLLKKDIAIADGVIMAEKENVV